MMEFGLSLKKCSKKNFNIFSQQVNKQSFIYFIIIINMIITTKRQRGTLINILFYIPLFEYFSFCIHTFFNTSITFYKIHEIKFLSITQLNQMKPYSAKK